jgi:hypothetical protein
MLHLALSGSTQLQQKQTLMDHDSVVAFWRSMLAKNGFGGGTAREQRVAKFIAKNQITKIEHLKYADHPSKWLDAEGITPDELQAVWNLRGVVRQRSRFALSNLTKARGDCACCSQVATKERECPYLECNRRTRWNEAAKHGHGPKRTNGGD